MKVLSTNSGQAPHTSLMLVVIALLFAASGCVRAASRWYNDPALDQGMSSADAGAGTDARAQSDATADAGAGTDTRAQSDAAADDGAWLLRVSPTSANPTMTVDLENPVDVVIDWGEGAPMTYNTSPAEHTYAIPGTYTLSIRGRASRIGFNNPNAQAILTGILSPVRGIRGLTSFENTFRSCRNLATPIPPGLFDNTPDVTTFGAVFMDCTSLPGPIPKGLFDHTPLVTDFGGVFAWNPQFVSTIPAGLFDKSPLATTFAALFYASGVSGAIPPGLFDAATRATNFKNTFRDCFRITSIPPDLFAKTPNVTTFHYTFAQAFSSIRGPVPELWISHPAALHPKTFAGNTGASNWNDIPADWK